MSKNNYVGKLSFSATVVARFLSLYVVLLAISAIAAAQPVPLAIQRVWTRDAGGHDKATFATGETIQFVAQLNNSYSGYLLSAELTITTSFYNNSSRVDIPPGISAWAWNATAPAQQGNYTVTVKTYDNFYGRWAEGSAGFITTGDDYPYGSLDPNDVDPWAFYFRECTSFVAWRMNQAMGTPAGPPWAFDNNMNGPNGMPGHWGNAHEWDENATRIGYHVDGVPAMGAVAQWNGTEGGASLSGHVAYVVPVNVDGSVLVEEYNALSAPNDHKYSTRTVRAPRYIHIADR
jgi:surface antigen